MGLTHVEAQTTHSKPRALILVLAFAVAVAALAFVLVRPNDGAAVAEPTQRTNRSVAFNGDRAYQHLVAICEFGPRVSGSSGMRQQQEYLTEHFERLGGIVTLQQFSIRHPQTGRPVPLANLIVEWHPERQERILLCAHYDTRPYPDQDPNPARRRDPFIGANDGASGCALLAEMAEHMPTFESALGVDFVLFDAEEFVYDDDRDEYFVGSTYFAEDYASKPPRHTYRWGVLFDMVADRQLQLLQEQHSVRWRDTRPLVSSIWRTARQLGVREFIPQRGYLVRDDHLPLRNIARIPTCDIIDFDYGTRRGSGTGYWHTTHDTPDKCSATSLAKVGWVVHEWLKSLE